ncbi:MAG TPA: esterase, partial [Burkholderiales bacterium]|nr:esterase [Burkholderiales bacterium]
MLTRITRAALCALLLAGCATQQPPIALRDMGSFHVGGREVTISGKPVKEVVFTPGGVPAKIDPNGTYVVESMYVQYFLPANRRG